MVKITVLKFLESNLDSGSGSGSGHGYGDGYGDGCGFGDGSGDGYGYGYSYGDGDGYGDGYGSGSGDGHGSGSGNGDGYGSGYGVGLGRINGETIHQIDGVPTLIANVKGSVAKGFILNQDLTLCACYIGKVGNFFAHGRSAKIAMAGAKNKFYTNMDTDVKITEFKATHDMVTKYKARYLYNWHQRLTGSCKMGRKKFVSDNEIDLGRDEYTIPEFIALTKDSFGGEIILRLGE